MNEIPPGNRSKDTLPGIKLDPTQLAEINRFLQTQLQTTGKAKVGAIEAAGWLAEAGAAGTGQPPRRQPARAAAGGTD